MVYLDGSLVFIKVLSGFLRFVRFPQNSSEYLKVLLGSFGFLRVPYRILNKVLYTLSVVFFCGLKGFSVFLFEQR